MPVLRSESLRISSTNVPKRLRPYKPPELSSLQSPSTVTNLNVPPLAGPGLVFLRIFRRPLDMGWALEALGTGARYEC
eukprot:1615340-Rhodomonas_salina.1